MTPQDNVKLWIECIAYAYTIPYRILRTSNYDYRVSLDWSMLKVYLKECVIWKKAWNAVTCNTGLLFLGTETPPKSTHYFNRYLLG